VDSNSLCNTSASTLALLQGSWQTPQALFSWECLLQLKASLFRVGMSEKVY
jgi:hypothetical protein